MALVFNIDMADDSVVSNIIYNDSNKKDEMKGCFSAFSMPSSRSLLTFLDKSTEKYYYKLKSLVLDERKNLV